MNLLWLKKLATESELVDICKPIWNSLFSLSGINKMLLNKILVNDVKARRLCCIPSRKILFYLLNLLQSKSSKQNVFVFYCDSNENTIFKDEEFMQKVAKKLLNITTNIELSFYENKDLIFGFRIITNKNIIEFSLHQIIREKSDKYIYKLINNHGQ